MLVCISMLDAKAMPIAFPQYFQNSALNQRNPLPPSYPGSPGYSQSQDYDCWPYDECEDEIIGKYSKT